MSEELKLRPEVFWFAQQMERKLREHDNRPGWDGEDFDYLFDRLKEETTELESSIAFNLAMQENPRIIDEAADVANFAMMIADLVRDDIGEPLPAADERVRALVEWASWAWQYIQVTGGPRWEEGRALVRKHGKE